jgi:hypothetical protein
VTPTNGELEGNSQEFHFDPERPPLNLMTEHFLRQWGGYVGLSYDTFAPGILAASKREKRQKGI